MLQIHEEHPDNIESLQYLEALCKDLGRSHEEYSKKLEKLRRSQPQAAVTQQAGGTVRLATTKLCICIHYMCIMRMFGVLFVTVCWHDLRNCTTFRLPILLLTIPF